MKYVLVCDLDREENMKIAHTIAIGTLVEVDLAYSEQHGVRGFIVEHTRDCDGTSLYAISLMRPEDARALKEMNAVAYRFTVSDGWTDDCLKIIQECMG
jgi:hypothetical protein